MKGAAKGGLAKPGLHCPEKGRPVPPTTGGMKTSKSSSSLSSEVRLSKLKRASSDDTLAKPGLGSALATSRMRKTVTTGAISELAEARPRGIPADNEANDKSVLECQVKELLAEAKAKEFEISKLRTELKRFKDKGTPDAESPESLDQEMDQDLLTQPAELQSLIKMLREKNRSFQHELAVLREENQLVKEKLLMLELSPISSSDGSNSLPASLGSPTKHPVNGVILDNARPPVNCNPLKNSTSSSSDVTKGTPSPDSSEFENIVPSRTYSVSSGIGKGKGSGGQNTPHYSRELSMECLTEQIQKMEESHHSTAEELQATLQELSDQQQVVQELTAENERLATEKSLLQSSLNQQRERVEHLAQKNEGLMSRLQEQSQSEEAEARAARIFELEQRYAELVERSRFEREKLVDIQQQLTGSLRSLEKEHQESQGLIKSLKEEKEHIQRKLEAEEEANNKVTRRFEDCTANTEALKVENGKLKVQLDVEKQKVVELKAMQSASDNSELQNLLKAAHSEKERLDLACTELKQELLQASGEADRLQGMLNKVEVEHKQLQQLCDQQREQLSSSAHKLQERTCEKDSEIKDLKETIFELEDQEDAEEWRRFQADLQTAVVVANDIKSEAAQEVRALRRRLQEEQDHSASLARELQELQGSRLKNDEEGSSDADSSTHWCGISISQTPVTPSEPPATVKSLIKSFDTAPSGPGHPVQIHSISRSPLSGIPVRTAPAAAVSPMQNIDVTNFSSSWSDGLAFCALLHTYLPAHIPYQELSSHDKNRNLTLAFQAAESVGIKSTLDIAAMMHTDRPDWQSVMQYAAQIYKYFET
ncbi:UNVERIFIED_CONTAM: hypothetical protein FKN15_046019 [Acipenser sinensis]